jgi:hypothetical protein
MNQEGSDVGRSAGLLKASINLVKVVIDQGLDCGAELVKNHRRTLSRHSHLYCSFLSPCGSRV